MNASITDRHSASLEHKLRSLDSFEEFFFYMEQVSPALHCQMVHFTGSVEEGRWRKAWEDLHFYHPLLHTQLCKEPGERPCFVRSKGLAPISVIDSHPIQQMTTFLEAELAKPFQFREGPLVRAAIIRGPNESLVAVLAHHSLYDGMGSLLLLQDLLRAASGASRHSSVGAWTSLRDAVGSPDRGGYRKVLGDAEWEKQNDYETVDTRVYTRYLKLSSELTSGIEQRARVEGTTPHGALMAAMQLAGGRTRAEWLRDGLYCNTPHDVRRALPNANNLPGMLTIPLITFLRPAGDRPFWEMAREYRADLAQPRSAEARLAFVRQMDELTTDEQTPAAFLQRLIKSPIQYELMITDFAAYRPVVDYGDLHLKAIATGNNGGATQTQTIGVCTLDGSMNLTQISKQPIEHLLESAREILSKACS
ncbi:condensation domain-containing protein [Silvibacterium acidisoli]|uniref:condensation domain-containing protein n=1 Tax=Acidobacteriaceae bacterium ZG23-2 TaxID=2883246 RepID=UPI00406CC59F